MAGGVQIDVSQVQAFVDRLGKAAKGDFKKELRNFMEGLGEEFLRILQDEIVRLKVVDTSLLLNSFSKGAGDNVWVMSGDGLTLEVGTNVKYAKFVNDGHWTNPKGVQVRFVPGTWNGSHFEYQPGVKTGMVLKMHWVEGTHYWESALRILEKMYPKLLDAKVQQWLDRYFSQFA